MIKNIINKILNKHSDAMSFKEAFDLTEHPICTFYQGDKKIHLLLDTGSNNCIIDSTFLKSLEHTMLNLKNTVSGLDGIEKESDVCTIKMSYKDKEYEYPYMVRDMSPVFDPVKKETGVTIHGILGAKFFNDYKYVLDFDELKAYSKE